MDHITPASLSSWQNFYVIVGSSAGALTGLQFVVITLVTQTRAVGDVRDIRAFGTPTVIHFCTALLIAAGLAAPWQTLTSLAVCVAVGGVAGIVYCSRVIWHAREAAYEPDTEDWIWYVVLPLAAHFILLAAAVLIWSDVGWSLAIIAADALLFLVLGVHNAWDTVTFIATRHASSSNTPETAEPSGPHSS